MKDTLMRHCRDWTIYQKRIPEVKAAITGLQKISQKLHIDKVMFCRRRWTREARTPMNAMHWCTWALSFRGSVGFTAVVPAGPVPELTAGTLGEGAGVGLVTVACNQYAGVRTEYSGHSRCTLKYEDEMRWMDETK